MVVVFGSINVDLVARVARIPAPGETLAGSAFFTAPGGKGANQALAARRAGARVALFGAVGDDAFANQALSGLRNAGVNLLGVQTVDTGTGVALISVANDGENAIVVVPGANARALASEVPDHALTEDSTLLMQLEVPMREVEALVARARATRMRCVLNAAPALLLSRSLLEQLDILVLNRIEAAALATAIGVEDAPETLIATLLQRFNLLAVVTLGAQGALTFADGRLLRATPPAVTVRDTTGAGDALAGALCAALDRGMSLQVSLAEGVAAGALACGQPGAQEALPDLAAICAAAKNVELNLAH